MNPSTPAPRRFLLPKRGQQQQQQQQKEEGSQLLHQQGQTPQFTQVTPGGAAARLGRLTPKFTPRGTPKFTPHPTQRFTQKGTPGFTAAAAASATQGALSLSSSAVRPTARREVEDVEEGIDDDEEEDFEMEDGEEEVEEEEERVISSSVGEEEGEKGGKMWGVREATSRYGAGQDIEDVDVDVDVDVDASESPSDVDKVISSSADVEEGARVREGISRGPFAMASMGRMPTQRGIEDVEVLESQCSRSDEGKGAVQSSPGDGPAMNTISRNGHGFEALSDSESEDGEDGEAGMDKGEVLVVMSSSPEMQRVAKRRRITVSPGSSPLGGVEARVLFKGEGVVESSDDNGEEEGHGRGEDEVVVKSQTTDDENDYGSENGGTWNSEEEIEKRTAKAQPTFRSAPRFKPVEEGLGADGLPAAFFSPQRRGARYVPGGLAAGVQGWLSDVRRWDDEDAGMGREKTRVRVEAVNRGSRGYLVIGVASGDVKGNLDGVIDAENGGHESGEKKGGSKFVLAGEGRLTGLGRGMDVQVGSLVEVEGAVWEVEIGRERWTVCCDWGVVEG